MSKNLLKDKCGYSGVNISAFIQEDCCYSFFIERAVISQYRACLVPSRVALTIVNKAMRVTICSRPGNCPFLFVFIITKLKTDDFSFLIEPDNQIKIVA
ncbi:MAG: hypothetical protein NT010_06895 [Proteobacteria bacterium]|nr:hypothetical protein [Pseudomonadota bacterium]